MSAKSEWGVEELVRRYERHLGEHPEQRLGDICHTANAGRSHFEYRLAAVAASREQLRESLQGSLKEENPVGVVRGHADLSRRAEVVFLFTGQGGQYLQMGRGLYETEPVFREVVDRCEELVRPYLEKPLREVLYPKEGEASPLDETQYTHVAMYAVQYGLAQLWRSWGVEPAAVMGHSVGEIAASAVAGGMSLEEGLMLMRERGRLMQGLPRTGLMASLLAGEAVVAPVVERYGERVSIAAINGPESTVISGERGAVEDILRELEGKGIKTKPLNVSNSFHSPLVEPVLGEFGGAARRVEYRVPQVAQFSSMRLEWVKEGRLLDGEYWPYNLRNTVRFSQAMVGMYEQGYRMFVEMGPSPTLVGMGSQCVPAGQGVWLPSLRRERQDWEQMLESLGTLYVNGVNVDWKQFDGNRSRPVVLPTYPFQEERFAIDTLSSASRTSQTVDVSLPSGEQTLRSLAQAGSSLRVELLPSEKAGKPGIVRLVDEHNKVVAEFFGLPQGASASADSELGVVNDLGSSIYQVEWDRKELPAQAAPLGKSGKNWLIFADRGGIGVSLSSLLKERGDRCVLIFSDKRDINSTDPIFTIDPTRPSDFQSTIRDIAQRSGTSWDGIVHLWSLDCPSNEQLSSDSLRDAQLSSCGSVLRIIQSLPENAISGAGRLWVVTQGVQAAGPRPAPIQVAQAPVRGLSRVIAMEHPELRCVNIDLDPRNCEKNIGSLFQELSDGDDEDQIAFRQGVRYVARLRRTTVGKPPLPAAALPAFFKPDATYLISGGLGDLGMKVAQWMAVRGARHLVLMGRRAASDQVSERLNAMRKAGTNVVVFQGDVALREDVERLLSMIQVSMPALRGLIHAAGTWKGGVLLQQDWESFAEVLAPKVQGAWNLHELTRSMQLDFFVSFSSGASVLGAAGLGDYASANSFLDALAHYRHAEGLPGSSINWGPWADLGMVRSVTSMDTSRWSEHGMSSIPPELALHAVEEVIRQGTTQISVLPINWVKLQSGIPSLANSRFVRDLVAGAAKPEKPTDSTLEKILPGELRRISDPAEQRRILTNKLQAEAARVLRLPVSKMDVNRSLNQYGMDSLMALELKNRMQAAWGMAVPLATILSGPPVTKLVAFLMEKLEDHSADPELATTAASSQSSGRDEAAIDSQKAQELLRKLPELSDDDVDAILGKMASGNDAERSRQK